MIGIILKGHDYKYEVAELLKLFTTQFKFIDGKDVGMIIENRVVYYNDNVFAKSVYCENYQAKFDCLDHRSIKGLSEQEIRKVTKETIKRSMFNVLMKKFNSYVPWGILTGIRPVKIVHNLLDKGLSDEIIRENLKENYFISDEKIDLALDIAKRERVFIYPIDKNKISLYVSIPFCPTRCLYCSFPANPIKQFGHLKREYVYKLIEEVKGLAKLLKETNKEIETLYIGGGTPTTLDEEELDILITALFKELDLTKIKEFTVEAGRPDSITRGKLEVLKRHNVGRISINPQTMNDETLSKIGRDHKVSEIVDCFNMARELGFDNINMDIILGLMDENLDMVRNTLEEIKKLSPESLTVHTLAIKRASSLKENIDKYHLTQYEEMIKMIDLSMQYAHDMGLNPYYMYRQKHMLGNLENIGYAKEGYECIYNIQIMEEKQSNYALGAGAISKFVYVDEDRIERVDNVKNVEQYIDRVDEMINRKVEEVHKNVN
ncbi:coproporphyrinogen dehydrogenase HemZ [Romboutsia maritimum]|uniref:Coproporphyrinogen dehydrogenase HemZ n=1 Tax=Romboutsia maritimum TaxID=2020948 RepID=A0A371IRD0_9FIRM|nr:coproporphyrinogen dehydrogenase HemZ [Romboutsia maritimum]RDY23038.1 coproporphyrinogen dehydrogenase HemZ [Romboutsia maritimum]